MMEKISSGIFSGEFDRNWKVCHVSFSAAVAHAFFLPMCQKLDTESQPVKACRNGKPFARVWPSYLRTSCTGIYLNALPVPD